MQHFIVKITSTSTEKEEEHEGELIRTDAKRGMIDPFGGAKPRLSRQGKAAQLRVNPEQPGPLVRQTHYPE
jgi:hypothetical protein